MQAGDRQSCGSVLTGCPTLRYPKTLTKRTVKKTGRPSKCLARSGLRGAVAHEAQAGAAGQPLQYLPQRLQVLLCAHGQPCSPPQHTSFHQCKGKAGGATLSATPCIKAKARLNRAT